MPPPSALPDRRGGRAVASRRRRNDAERRRLAVLVAIVIVAIGTLLVTAFGGGDHPTPAVTAPTSAARLLPTGPPPALAIAAIPMTGSSFTLNVPVSRYTAIGFFAASDGALGLTPIGSQGNQGLLRRVVHAIFGGASGAPRWYLLPGGDGPSTSALDVGATPGTDVYSPVDGTVVGIERVVLNGRVYGARIDIQPHSAPALVVSVSDLRADPALTLGSPVTARSTKLGVLIDLSKVETQALARYTNDAGNHVLIEVHAAASLGLS